LPTLPPHVFPTAFLCSPTTLVWLGLSFKLIQQAERHWRGIQHPERLRELFSGVIFVDGLPANETRQDSQQDAA
jgi:hypothetical protein